ncbi:SusC/RagA family TonB-linked outer membrane protein [Marinilabilia salmonicolor]|nr:SusC/RagA family TonB-linked outer membrane protein [Marinilabilia salmonicolor]
MKKNRMMLCRYRCSWEKTLRIMKISLVLLVFCGLTLSASPTKGQNQSVTLEVENATILDVFRQIEEVSNLGFFFKNDQLDLKKRYSLNLENASVEEILNQVLDLNDYDYQIVGENVVVTRKTSGFAVSPQQSSVSGTVTDAAGEPVPGVTVTIKGTTTGTITDVDGHYELNNVSEDATLVFSFVGMKTREVLVESGVINVQLEEAVIGLDEIVAIGYGRMKKADVTSSVSTVKSDDFVKGGVRDVGQLIQGKVAGLTVTSPSGDPTGNTEIRLRGNTTLYGTSTAPLILIDGVPGDFNSVAPEDIESIDVLKDGSAAAIYGTRGTNGVIIITTKRASGIYDAKVEYTGYVSTQQIANELDVLTADDYRRQINEGIRSESDDLGASTNWLDEITRTPVSQVHNLTIRGGDVKTNYLASVNFNDRKGIFLKSNKETFTARTDINHSMFDGVLKVNFGIISRNIKYGTTGDGYGFNGYTYRQALIYNPTAPVKLEDGDWYENVGAFNYDNPVARIKESEGENKNQWSRVNGNIVFNPFDGMSVKALLSYSKYNQTRGYYETRNHISTKRSGLNGYGSNGAIESIDRLVELTGEYQKTFDFHHFSILGGYSYSDNDWRDFYMTNQEFPTDEFGYNNIDLGQGIEQQGTSSGIGSSRSKTNLIGFFSRGTYSFANKYLFMGSVRYEAASQLWGTEDPWGLFPSASVGWRISEEPFMAGVGFVEDLKLRAGYGVTGTQPSASFLGVATLGYTGQVNINDKWVQTIGPTRNENPYLRWEEKKETNVGVDFAFINGRIGGSIDYYNREIDGLLWDFAVPVPPNMVGTTTANVGVMSNKGLEFLVNAIPVRNSDIEWSTTVSFSTNTNKLKSLSNELYQTEKDYFTTGGTGEPIQTYTHRVDIGGPIGNFYGFKVVDVDENGKWIYQDGEGNLVSYDDFERSDENKQVLGNGLPKYYASWNHNLRYKNFDLSITMRGAFDYQILNFERMYLENTKTTQYNRLQSAYDPVFGKAVLSNEVDLEYNSYYIEDGDFWKIDNITLGYNIPLKGDTFKSFRVYASSLNTLTITGYKGIDPEVTASGLAPGNDNRDKYPTTRTFTLGVNVSF